MKLRSQTKPILSLCLAVLFWVFTAHTVQAQSIITSFLGLNGTGWEVFNTLISWAANMVLYITSWLVTLSGALLNVSMYLTTHLDLFIKNSDVIYTVWGIIRDFSNVILIFFVLWAAIQMILGLRTANFSSLIFSIIVMGVLINFSFFFTRVIIDASNIVSLQFYNAIAPEANIKSITTISDLTDQSIYDGGISDVFMGALKVQSWYGNYGQFGTGSTDVAGSIDSLKIILISTGGIIVMLLTSMSFLAAAVATIVRSVLLIFLLAFSPIWVATWALPKIKDYTKKWTGAFWTQILFLPVYLLFMYVAIRILTESNLNNFVGSQIPSLQTGLLPFINLFVGFAIVIFMLNLPLFAAMQVAGQSMGWTDKMFKGMRGAVGGWVGRNTLGQAAYVANKSSALSRLAQLSPATGMAVSSGLSKISSSTFGGSKGGYDAALKKEKKNIEAMHKKLGEVERSDYKTDDEFKAAKKAAEAAQASFREALPTRSILYGMMKSRGARESAAKLSKKASDDAIKKGEKEDLKKLAQLRRDRAGLLEKSPLILTGRLGEDVEKNKKEKIDAIDKQIEELESRIEKARELKEEEKESKIMSKLEEMEKKSDSGDKK